MEIIAGKGTGIVVNFDAFANDKVTFTDEQIAALSKQSELFVSSL